MSVIRYLLQWLCLFIMGLLLSRQDMTGVIVGSLAIATGLVMIKPIGAVAKTRFSRMPRWTKAFLWLPGVLHLKKRGFDFGGVLDPLSQLQRRLLFSDTMRVTAHNFHRHKAWSMLPLDVVTFRSPNDSAIMHAVKQRKLAERFHNSNNLPPLRTIPEYSPPTSEVSHYTRIFG